MSTEIIVPSLGESVSEATVAQWFKKPGDAVEADEPILELETDKVALEVNAPKAGVLSDIKVDEGDTVEVGDLLGLIDEGAEASASSADDDKSKEAEEEKDSGEKAQADREADEEAEADEKPAGKKPAEEEKAEAKGSDAKLAPAAARLVEEKGVDASRIEGTGRGGRVTKADVIKFLEEGGADKPAAKEEKKAPKSEPASKSEPAKEKAPREIGEREERVPMSRLRRTIARRLKEAQDTAAMLTTFNEIDVSALLEARENYKELFEKKHNVRLGFMSFFAKACVTALHDLPAVNAEIDGDDIIYKNHYDIGVAVSAPQGLVVPVVRDVDQLSLAGIEKAVGELARKARDGELSMAELQGGTFTITNGGVFGSLMSTPILNTPQSGILGMHKIQERPVAIDGEVQVRPMMYVALSYDHRIVDGREAVTFLVRIKELLEDPHRMLLDL